MDYDEASRIVKELNKILKNNLWMDLQVSEVSSYNLTITGGISPSYSPEITIHFSQVFFMSLPMDWTVDPVVDVISIVVGEEAKVLNMRFQVEQGYHIFRFSASRYPKEFGCLVCAQEISYFSH